MDPFTASGSWSQPLTTLIEKKFYLMSRFVLFISRLNIDEFNLVLTVEAEFNLVNQVFFANIIMLVQYFPGLYHVTSSSSLL